MPDREYVIKCLKYLHDKETWKEGPLVWDDHAEDRKRITADALSLLREQEAVKPKKGLWLHPTYLDCCCSVCGMQPEHEPGEDVPLYPYCPYCGAKMEVKWDETHAVV